MLAITVVSVLASIRLTSNENESRVTVAVELAPVNLRPLDAVKVAFGFDGSEAGNKGGTLLVTVNRGFLDSDPTKEIFTNTGILCFVRYGSDVAKEWVVQPPCDYVVPPSEGRDQNLVFTATFESADGTKTGSATYEVTVQP